jgi:hypothetical protein
VSTFEASSLDATPDEGQTFLGRDHQLQLGPPATQPGHFPQSKINATSRGACS